MTVTSGARHPGLQGQEKVSHKLLSAPDPRFLVLSSTHVLLPPCGIITNWQDRSSLCGQLVLIFWTVWSLQNVRRKEASLPTAHGMVGGGVRWGPLLCSKARFASVTEKAKESRFPSSGSLLSDKQRLETGKDWWRLGRGIRCNQRSPALLSPSVLILLCSTASHSLLERLCLQDPVVHVECLWIW